MRRGRAFTLIELLVVITIIGLLAGLLFPLFGQIKAAAHGAKCTNNLRQIATALMTYEGEHGMMPWYQAGPWGSYLDKYGATQWREKGSMWYDTLRNKKYLPMDRSNGVWRCPAVPQDQAYKNNWGGYGICASIFRREINKGATGNESKGSHGKMLRTESVPRPAQTWLIGDCGQPLPYSQPGSVQYLKPSADFGRPGRPGDWRLNASFPPNQPAMRHRGMVLWAAFDGHVSQMSWSDMLAERDNFTARNESF
jgi:prepilin-type N-terminal cleavage/methylation domain-containing protein